MFYKVLSHFTGHNGLGNAASVAEEDHDYDV